MLIQLTHSLTVINSKRIQMINIISPLANSSTITGPMKVLTNTIKGFDLINYPYVFNHSLNSTKRVWIQNGRSSLPFVQRAKSKIVIGPNTAVMPSDLRQYNLSNSLYLQPSPWAASFWTYLGFDECPIKSWPAGIDTTEFYPKSNSIKKHVLLYYKNRNLKELNYVICSLTLKNVTFVLVPYGNYNQAEFQSLLANTTFVVWLGGHESQGIALQEAMASNIPILVCDATKLSQAEYEKNPFSALYDDFMVSSAPYFNDSCGIKITKLYDFPKALEKMLDTWQTFNPREFILNNLSLDGQAKALIEMWEYWDISLPDGYGEKLLNSNLFSVPLSFTIKKKATNLYKSLTRRKGKGK